MSILLIGANGRTGRQLAQRLGARELSFKAVIRRSDQAGALRALGAEIVLADLNHDFSHAFDAVETVIYAAGSGEAEGVAEERAIDRDAVIQAVDAARRRHLRRFVLIGSISAYAPEQAPFALRHYSRMKREADDYLIGSGLDYLILRPGPLSDGPAAGRVAPATQRAATMPAVTRADVAELALEALELGIHRRVLGFVGGDVPIAEVLAPLHRRQG
ncbi:MAG: NAD(P)H-binding protein [Janthinobacterium lividum]